MLIRWGWSRSIGTSIRPFHAAAAISLLLAATATPSLAGDERKPGEPYPITLEAALRLADERNVEIALQIEEVKRAVLAHKDAYLEWLPTLRAGGSYARQNGALQETAGLVSDIDRDAQYSGLGVGALGSAAPSLAGASLEIDFARAIFEPLVAKQRKLASRAENEATRARVFLEVAEAYYALTRAHQSVGITAQAKAEARQLASVTGDFAETGEGLLADAERAAVESLLLEAEEEEARGDLALASSSLARLLRLDDAVRLEPPGNYIIPLSMVDPGQSEEECIARALVQRPELRAQHALVSAAHAALKEGKFGPFIPRLRGAYSYGDFRGGNRSGPTNSGDRHDIGVALYWQLDGLGFGQYNAAQRRASELREARLEKAQTLSDIIAQVKSAHSQLTSADRRLGITRRTIVRARKAHELNRERVFENQGLPLESLQAMQALATAERLHLRAATDFNTSQLRLHTAMGSHLRSALDPAEP
ncbi:MAG: TolC family protein [Verrucomicrobiales bacterium]